MQETLNLKDDIKIVPLSRQDILQCSERFGHFQTRILACRGLYPGIDSWLYRKVVPGLLSVERTAFLGYKNGHPIATAIVKNGERAKFCHLKIDEGHQGRHLGEVFFSLMALEVKRIAKEVHFSLPESLWEHQRSFFNSFGFRNIVDSDYRYRSFERELYCSASYSEVWKNLQDKLPRLASVFSMGYPTLEPSLLFSVRPEYSRGFLDGKKRIEIRKKFDRRWVGYRIVFYETAPSKRLVGEATICAVQSGSPASIWRKFGNKIGCSEGEFQKYVGSAENVYAIELEGFNPYSFDASMVQLSSIMNEMPKPPQSYCLVNPLSKWSEAISLVHLMDDGPGLSLAQDRSKAARA